MSHDEARTVCDHRRAEHSAPARLLRGPPTPDGPQHGFHVAQPGRCLACGAPLLRLSAQVALGAWEAVGEPDPARVRTAGHLRTRDPASPFRR
jgi:hypothetical protein